MKTHRLIRRLMRDIYSRRLIPPVLMICFMIGYSRISSNTCSKKVLDSNNSAYVDSFFSYLSSKLLNNTGFVHGFNFFGSFLTIQNQFKLNIYDDLDYLYYFDFFNKII